MNYSEKIKGLNNMNKKKNNNGLLGFVAEMAITGLIPFFIIISLMYLIPIIVRWLK